MLSDLSERFGEKSESDTKSRQLASAKKTLQVLTIAVTTMKSKTRVKGGDRVSIDHLVDEISETDPNSRKK